MRTKRAALYIRQSAVRDQDTALSASVQTNEGLALAARDGIPPASVRVFTDLGKSGGAGKESRRPEYQRMLTAVEKGEIDVLYTISLTRIARSAGELERVFALLDRQGVRLVSGHESFDPTTAAGRAMMSMMIVFAGFERELAVERQLDNIAERRRRGERLGAKPYAERYPIEPVIQAYKDAGSLMGAALLLNERGVPAPHKVWNSVGLRIILGMSAPELLPVRTARGAKPSGGFRFFRLLKCYCGALLTGSTTEGRWVNYRCHSSGEIPGHGYPRMVAESLLMDSVKAEVARIAVAAKTYESGGEDVANRLAVLEARKVRLNDMYEMGTIPDRADYVTRMAAIEDRIADLSQETRARKVVIPDLDSPDISPATINAALRDLFQYVELGPDLRPVRFEWTVPEWRVASVASSATA